MILFWQFNGNLFTIGQPENIWVDWNGPDFGAYGGFTGIRYLALLNSQLARVSSQVHELCLSVKSHESSQCEAARPRAEALD
jgi:hypothetical protein